MDDKCPKCKSERDLTIHGTHWRCGSYGEEEGFGQSDACRIRELEAEVERLVGILDRLYVMVQHETALPECGANGVVSDSGDDEGLHRCGMILEDVRVPLVGCRAP